MRRKIHGSATRESWLKKKMKSEAFKDGEHYQGRWRYMIILWMRYKVLFIKSRVFCMFSLLQGESELKSCRANEALIRYFLLVKEMEEIM